MGLFLRIETNSNILGSKEKDVTYIALSQITSVGSDGNGGSVIVYGAGNSQTQAPEVSPDSLLSDCIVNLAP
tara:strand:- start:3091 stop:3306 length:216 start_codon:yes stop_codon:yes gene_type:complete